MMTATNGLTQQVDKEITLQTADKLYATFVKRTKPCIKKATEKGCEGLDISDLSDSLNLQLELPV
jgi:hypothetical protein